MNLKEKCKMVQQCLPESPFRDQVTKLHNEMISLLQEAADRIEALEEALRDIENLQYGLYGVCVAAKIASEALDT